MHSIIRATSALLLIAAAAPALAQTNVIAAARFWDPPDPTLIGPFEFENVPLFDPTSVHATMGTMTPSQTYSEAFAQGYRSLDSISTQGSVNSKTGPFMPLAANAQASFDHQFTVVDGDMAQLVLSYILESPFADPSFYSGREVFVEVQRAESGGGPWTTIHQASIGLGSPDTFLAESQSLLLLPGNYLLSAHANSFTATIGAGPGEEPVVTSVVPDALTWDVSAERLGLVLPDSTAGGVWSFFGVPGGRWVDPVTANGFEFEMLSEGSAFTEAGMPFGLGDSDGYTLSYLDGVTPVVVHLNEGENHLFPAGVTSFQVLDIDPLFDPEDPLAFPIYLDYLTSTADFTMTPLLVPEPSSLVLLALGGLLLAWRRRKKRD